MRRLIPSRHHSGASCLHSSPTQTSRRTYHTTPTLKAPFKSPLSSPLVITPEVADALATNRPVVALESTIYTHGALGALHLEDIVRKHGAVPAVCGVLAGVPTVGLTPQEVERMIEEGARKVSRRDLAYIVGMVSEMRVPKFRGVVDGAVLGGGGGGGVWGGGGVIARAGEGTT